MFSVQATTTIARPAKEVSAFLADPTNEKTWQRDIIHVERVGGSAGVVGATHERVQLVGGRNIKATMELVRHDPGAAVAFQGKGKVIELKVAHTLKPAGKGTALEMKIEGEMLGFASMFESMAAEELQKIVDEAMPKLKAALEKA